MNHTGRGRTAYAARKDCHPAVLVDDVEFVFATLRPVCGVVDHVELVSPYGKGADAALVAVAVGAVPASVGVGGQMGVYAAETVFTP